MQACSFSKFCLGMCDWTDSSIYFIDLASASAAPGHTPNLNVTFNGKSKADVRQPLTLEVARTATDTVTVLSR